MNNKVSLAVLREAHEKMTLWAGLDAEAQPLYDRFRRAVDHIDKQLSDPDNEYAMVKVHILVGRVSEKLQIPYEDAKNMVVEVLGEETTAGIVCGLLLEIP